MITNNYHIFAIKKGVTRSKLWSILSLKSMTGSLQRIMYQLIRRRHSVRAGRSLDSTCARIFNPITSLTKLVKTFLSWKSPCLLSIKRGSQSVKWWGEDILYGQEDPLTAHVPESLALSSLTKLMKAFLSWKCLYLLSIKRSSLRAPNVRYKT